MTSRFDAYPSSSSTAGCITQHSSSPAPASPISVDGHNGQGGRSPFVPVRKHAKMSQGSSSGGGGGGGGVESPERAAGGYGTTVLGPSSAHNLPVFKLQSPGSPAGHTAQSRKVLTTSVPSSPSPSATSISRDAFYAANSSSTSQPAIGSGSGPGTFTAPKVRAKLTPAATPRRKGFLPGTEFADVPTPRSTGAIGVMAARTGFRSPPPLPPPQPNSNPLGGGRGYGAFPTSPGPTRRECDDESQYQLYNQQQQQQTRAIGLGFGSGRAGDTSASASAYATHLPYNPTATIATSSHVSTKSRGGKDNVLVCVRVRPPAAKLAAAASTSVEEKAWDVDEPNGRLQLRQAAASARNGGASARSSPAGSEFVFDSIVTGSDNERVYQDAGRELVVAAMEGFDSVIFAYGQTASGKTFTLTGNAANPGIIPQAVTEIFTYIRDHPEQEFLLRASYLEIYNETLKDLLAPETGPLRIRQDEKKRFFVHPLREEVVTGEAQVAALLRRGEANRSIGATDYNETSSRSHSLFQMTIESRDEATSSSSADNGYLQSPSPSPNGPRLGGAAVKMSRLSLIDLAGSEQATSQAERRSEGAFINKSLLTLEKVIASLTDDSKRKPHVPYRDSKLTQILQPSLSGDALVAVIATMNPSPAAVEETRSTLKFAQRVKKVVLKATVNEVVDDKTLIFKYRAEIARLQAQLVAQQAQPSAPSTPSLPALDEDMKKLSIKSSSRVQGLESQIAELRSLFITSENVEDRRRSMMPPRPVSPMKPRTGALLHPGSITEEEPTDNEKLLEAQDEIAYLKDENADLKARIAELEDEQLTYLKNGASTSESDKDARIAQLVQENQELVVVLKNADVESDLRKQEAKMRREQDKRYEVEQRLIKEVEFERNRIKKMEHYIISKLQSQVDILAGRRNSHFGSVVRPGGGMPRPSYGGLLPIMGESSPDLAQDGGEEFGQLEFFSEDARVKIQKSTSMLLV